MFTTTFCEVSSGLKLFELAWGTITHLPVDSYANVPTVGIENFHRTSKDSFSNWIRQESKPVPSRTLELFSYRNCCGPC